MANIRKDFLHQVSHRITASAEVVQVEDVSLKGWQRLWGRRTSDLAPGELLRQLEYKARWRGRTSWDSWKRTRNHRQNNAGSAVPPPS